MTLFRKKPVVIEAEQFTQERLEAYLFDKAPLPPSVRVVQSSCHPGDRKVWGFTAGIETLEGFMTADIGDWVITGVKGERYPCKPGIFAVTYEPADGQALELDDTERWETGLRNIVTILGGARKPFEIKEVVETIRKIVHGEADGPVLPWYEFEPDPAMAGDSRAAFEAMCKENGIPLTVYLDGRGYSNERTKAAFMAWNESRKRVQPASGENAK